jgi:PleD family two-component response regulator
LALFSVDNLAELSKKLSQGDMATIYKKLAEMLGLYEQPLDILGQLKDGTFFFLMARNSKDAALLESEKIVESTKESLFVTGDTTHRLTLSASLMLKIPSKTIEESIEDGTKILAKAKEQGGNRVAQLRERPDSFR